MVASIILCAIIAILWISSIWSRRRYHALANKIPGPMSLPIIGVAHRFLNFKDILYELHKLPAECRSKTLFFWFGPYPIIYTKDPETVKTFLTSQDCINKSVFYDEIVDVLGDGIFVSKSERWSKHRKLLISAFSQRVLLQFVPNFNMQSRELCDELDKHVNCGEVNVKEFIFQMTLKVALGTTLGSELDQRSGMTFLRHFERGADILFYRIAKPWLKSHFIFRLTKQYKLHKESIEFIKNFTSKLIMDKLKILHDDGSIENKNKSNSMADNNTKHTFLDQIFQLHQLNKFTVDDIIVESRTLLFAAFDTTASTLFSTIMCLAMHQEYQDKVFEEILTVFPEKEFDVKFEDLKKLVYLDMCINEALRILPVVPMVARVSSKDVPLPKGIVVPKATQILIDILGIHRDEDTWGSNAEDFNPDHFLPENLINIHNYSFMPFLKGPRNCIGWQYARVLVKIVLIQVLRKYRFSTKFSFKDLKLLFHLTLKYQEVPYLEIQRRT